MLTQEEADGILEILKTRKGLKKSEIEKLIWKLQTVDSLHNDSVILEMLASEKGPLKSQIIQVLGKSKSQEAESALLEILESSKKYYEIYWSILGLRNCGTSRCIPILKKFLYFPKADIKIVSLGAIADIAGSSEAQLYVDLLNDSNYPEKGITILHIHKHCDDRAVEAVVSRLKNLLSRKRGPINLENEHTEITRIVDYLNRHIEKYPTIGKVFSVVLKKWDILYKNEKEFLRTNITYFSNSDLS